MKQLSAHLYVHEDTCNVYAVANGRRAVLIDFGDGGILDGLAALGIEEIEAVLMTHHHRDQGQGLAKANARGIPVWVPAAERDLFEHVDVHWESRGIDNSYNTRQDRFSLLEPVAVAGSLRDYAEHRFAGTAFTVVPTPGHTTGSVTLLAEVDGRRVAFTGDLIAASGKVWSMAATQWSYNGAEGVAVGTASLLDLKDRSPDVLAPSHGEPMARPAEAIDALIARFRELMQRRGQNPRLFSLRERPYEAVTPHLLKSRASMANYYVLLSDSGNALLFDFGYDFLTGIPAGSDRASRRPWLYSIPVLKRDYGVRRIDAVVPTHYHDDHVAGCNLLRDAEGTRVWAAEPFADILERPFDYDLPCLWYDPIPVDRRLPLGEAVRWEEYELTLHPLPGHARAAVAISLEADGKKVLVSGDQYQGDDGLRWNYVYQNGFGIGDYAASAGLFARVRPDVVLSGHWEPVWTTPDYFRELRERGEALERLHRELLPLAEADFGAEGFGARIMPYRINAAEGASPEIRVCAANPFAEPADVLVRLVVPEGVRAEPPERTVRLPARGTAELRYRLHLPPGWRSRRARVAADLTVGGRRFGQQAEALLTVR